jgi:hypothetical protein
MLWVLLALFILILFVASLSFNSYILISLLLIRRIPDKESRLGLSAVLGILITVILFKAKFFVPSVTFIPAYGAISGFLIGIYAEAKRNERKALTSGLFTKSESKSRPSLFKTTFWLSSTFRLLFFTLIGLGLTFSIGYLLNVVTIKSIRF